MMLRKKNKNMEKSDHGSLKKLGKLRKEQIISLIVLSVRVNPLVVKLAILLFM